MVQSILIVALVLGGSFAAAKYLVGYPRAGNEYITKHREARKSLRHGSGIYYVGGGRGIRGGK